MGRALLFRNKLRLSTRFALMVGAIVCAFCAGSAVLLYAYLSEKVIQDTYKRGQIVFALMDGIGSYVGNTLRPKMFTLVSHLSEEDAFVAEAMSTTRIRHGVMGYVGEKKPEFLYRRVSGSPRNPVNQADPFHARMIEHFKTNGQSREWHGISRQNLLHHGARLRQGRLHHLPWKPGGCPSRIAQAVWCGARIWLSRG